MAPPSRGVPRSGYRAAPGPLGGRPRISNVELHVCCHFGSGVVPCQVMGWFYVLCAVCADRYGITDAYAVFRVGLSDGRIQFRRRARSHPRTRWVALDSVPGYASVVCDHGHSWLDDLGGHDLPGEVRDSVVAAARSGSDQALLMPHHQNATPAMQWHANELYKVHQYRQERAR